MNHYEHIILSLTADVLNVPINVRHLEFYNGTLYIKDFDLDDANRVLNNLNYNNRFGKVQMSKVGNEFAYDFI